MTLVASLPLAHRPTLASAEATLFQNDPDFRPIHYLGSKLRVLEQVVALVDSLAPRSTVACDLFTGSGTVAWALSRTRPVIAADIQEYSRVLCSATLCGADRRYRPGGSHAVAPHDSALHTRLLRALSPLIDYEERCIERAIAGDADQLCELIEEGSLFGYLQNGERGHSKGLGEVMAEAAGRLVHSALHDSPASTVSRYFGGSYFSFRQAADLDYALELAHQAERDHRDVLLAAVLSTASDVVNTVGQHFAQPIQPRRGDGTPKKHLLRKIRRDRSLNVGTVLESWIHQYASLPARPYRNEVRRGDYRDILTVLPKEVGIVYADPPYTRDHYSRFYHVLETMCLRDNPPISKGSGKTQGRRGRGMYREVRHQSPFSIPSQVSGAFRALFEGVRRNRLPMVLSYSPYSVGTQARPKPRLLTIDELTSLAKPYFSEVSLASAGRLSHSKLNQSSRNVAASDTAELFLICKP